MPTAAGIEQKFAVAFGAEDRAFDDPDHRPARLRGDPRGGALADFAMDRRVAHDAAFADLRGAGLELRLDQRHQLRLLGGERERRRQHRRKADKARVAGDDVDRLGDVGMGQVARVDPFVDDDPRILAQLPGELAMTDIDGVNPPGTAIEQHLGEAAGRGADVEGDAPVDYDPEVIESVGEFDAAPRDPGMIAPLESERRFCCELFAGFVDAPFAAADQAGEDQRLRLGAALGETSLDEELIGPPLFSHPSQGQARAG